MTTPQASDIIALYRPRAGLPGATFAEIQAVIGGGAVPVEDEGSVVVAAPTALNFIGLGVTAADNAGVADITIPVVPVQDETVEIVANPSAINFAGAGVVVTDVAGVATVTIPQLFVPVEDEGSGIVANASAINFIGAGVTAVDNGGVADVTIPGGGGATVVVAAKNANTNRDTTTTLADDPDLRLTLTTGRWFVDGIWHVSTANSTPNFKYRFNKQSSLATAQDAYGSFSINKLGTEEANATNGITATFTFNLVAFENNIIRVWMTVNVTTGGDLVVQWAQEVSDANMVTFQAGSFLRGTKLD